MGENSHEKLQYSGHWSMTCLGGPNTCYINRPHTIMELPPSCIVPSLEPSPTISLKYMET